MERARYTAAVVLCNFLWFPVFLADCPYKECACAETIILCGYNNLQSIPRIFNTSATEFPSLIMENNEITTIPAGSLPSNLQDINFLNNPVESIDDTVFDGSATSLTTLQFSNTRLTRIPAAFGHLRALTYLAITGANITDWNEDAMMNIGQTMQNLQLESVGMTTWPNWTHYFSSLSELAIVGNAFSSIPDNAFDTLVNTLTSLSLYNNRLTMVPKALSKLNNLQMLYLQENQISDVSWLPQASKLSTLSLRNNTISNAVHLSEAIRPFGDSLMYLAIDNNQLNAIPDFSYLTKVGSLDFTNNRISDPNSGSAPSNLYRFDLDYNSLPSAPRILLTLISVIDIALSYNAIRVIQSSDFHSHTTSVDLGYNSISELPDTSFPENSGIMYLQLNNNPLTQISTATLKHLPNLMELNLKSTQLTRLPLGLSFLTKLSSLDVRGSPSLVCTCMESSLTTWVKTLRQENVLGNCGLTTVYDFFSKIASSCPSRRECLSD